MCSQTYRLNHIDTNTRREKDRKKRERESRTEIEREQERKTERQKWRERKSERARIPHTRYTVSCYQQTKQIINTSIIRTTQAGANLDIIYLYNFYIMACELINFFIFGTLYPRNTPCSTHAHTNTRTHAQTIIRRTE